MDEATQKSNKRRLRGVLVHKPMQREFTLVIISLLIISALTIGFVIHSTIHEAMMGGGYRFGKVTAYEVMSEVSYDLITRVSLVLFITVLAIAVFGIFFLHRIAGPVYRFRSVLHRITQGEIPGEFRLREGDYFLETMEDLNQVLNILRQRRERIQNLEDKLETAIQGGAVSAQLPLLNEIRNILRELK